MHKRVASKGMVLSEIMHIFSAKTTAKKIQNSTIKHTLGTKERPGTSQQSTRKLA